ncbi:MAG: MBL fold metallo-hydrolase, partial [Ruminiclostridium sp.]|nr:MBL fold metallo-hydrolase [Ruminiclostridium sp.]
MELEHVKGNTWVLKDWELIPLYKLDDHRCVLLDTGLAEQREALDKALEEAGLTPVGVLCSHAHIDHMGNNAFFKEKYGTQIAMSLGEAAHQFSYLAMGVPNYILSVGDLMSSSAHGGTIHLADRIILPGETTIEFCGAEFEILPTPGHTSDHICAKTPDNVLYLADAMMTGRTLHHSKFPYAYDMGAYLDSMRELRSVPADKYIVAHYGIYDEILPLIDME